MTDSYTAGHEDGYWRKPHYNLDVRDPDAYTRGYDDGTLQRDRDTADLARMLRGEYGDRVQG